MLPSLFMWWLKCSHGMDGFCDDTKSLPARATEPCVLVSNDSNKRRDRSCPEERQREISDTSTVMGSTAQQYGNSHETTPLYPTPNILIVDYTGFKLDQDIFIKELALYHPFATTCWIGTFQKPFSKTYCKKKVLANIDAQTETYGISWDEGQYPYSMLPHFLKYFANIAMYATSVEKAYHIQQFTDIPISHLPVPDDLPFGSYCPMHDATSCYCALDHAVRVGRWFADMHSFKPLSLKL